MNWIQKLSLTLSLSIFLVAVLELLSFTQVKEDIYEGDVGYFWRLKPHLDRQIETDWYSFHLRSNSLGLRDDEIDQQKERWLFLGCSTTLGWGVAEEDGFVQILQTHFAEVDIVNGGQPGWSTQQGLQGIELYQALAPTKVWIGFGVRDAQLSLREDKLAHPPSPLQQILMKSYTMQWLMQLKSSQQKTTHQDSNLTHPIASRVSPQDFQRNLQQLQQAFPNAEVSFYEFPQLDFSVDHHEVLLDKSAAIPTGFVDDDFFKDDPIHLNSQGHQKLAQWFIANLDSRANP